MRGYEGRDPADVTAMFRLAYDVAIRRCDVCERCGKAPVSKALRIKDPVWGAFDTPSNLLAVCDACYDAGRGRCLSRSVRGAIAARRGLAPAVVPAVRNRGWGHCHI
jgi:hypothetical protein